MGMAVAEGQKRIGQRPRKSWPKAKKALAKGQSPPQELEVSLSSGLYLLVNNNGCSITSVEAISTENRTEENFYFEKLGYLFEHIFTLVQRYSLCSVQSELLFLLRINII